MTNVILVGACGHMGKAVASCIRATPDMHLAAGVDMIADAPALDVPLVQSLSEVDADADVLIDFSRPDSLDAVLAYCTECGIGAVLATTGYTSSQEAAIEAASVSIPIFHAPNFSIGVALLRELAKTAARVLRDRCEVEIVERHHNRKVDAPSGTALAIADAISDEMPEISEYAYGRNGSVGPRRPNEIGIHAVRGGTLVGEHEVMFLSPDEELDIVHRAYSREIFAQGAVAAARFLTHETSGMYDMRSLLEALGLASS